jgi:uncharacterized protein
MRQSEAISALQERVDDIRALGATSLYIFGSTARDEAVEGSDLDLLIDYGPGTRFSGFDLVGIKQHLEDELQTPVDVTTRDSLHPMLREDIERRAIRVNSRDRRRL